MSPGTAAPARPRLAVWKFASCDGCQLTLLDCEDELLTVADAVDIAYFLEAGRADIGGPYDVSLVEGSITTPGDVERIRAVREASALLVTIGACATAGGIQALRNHADVDEFASIVYAHPEFLSTLGTSTPIAAHVPVDLELRGCPIDRGQLLGTINALLHGRRPPLPGYSVCVECKERGTPCITVAQGTPCLGPVTRAGCGALCPRFDRGCYGCFGPAEDPNDVAITRVLADHGVDAADRLRVFRTFNTGAAAFARMAVAADTGTAVAADTGTAVAAEPAAPEPEVEA